MGAEIEWLVGTLRMGKDFQSSESRDKYEFSGTIIKDGDEATIKGFNSYNSSDIEKEELRKELKKHNIKFLNWEHNGKTFRRPV